MPKHAWIAVALVAIATVAGAKMSPEFMAKYNEGRKYQEAKPADLVKAEKTFREAYEMAENDQERCLALLYVGHALGGQNKYEEAVKALKQATELENPAPHNLSGCYYTMAGFLQRLKKKDEAREAFEGVLNMKNPAANHVILTHLALAGMDQRARKYDAAKDHYNAVLNHPKADDEDRARAQLGLAYTLRGEGEMAQAVTALEEGLRYQKARPATRIALRSTMASFYVQMKNTEAAVDAYEKLLDMKGVSGKLRQRAENYIKANKK